MAFHFTYKYAKIFNRAFSERDVKVTLDFIEEFVVQKGANSTIIEFNRVTYKGSIINRTPVYKGVFQIETIGSDTKITFQIIVNLVLVIIPIASTILGIITSSIIMPIFCSVVVGTGFLVTLARYGDLFDDIVEEINKSVFLEED